MARRGAASEETPVTTEETTPDGGNVATAEAPGEDTVDLFNLSFEDVLGQIKAKKYRVGQIVLGQYVTDEYVDACSRTMAGDAKALIPFQNGEKETYKPGYGVFLVARKTAGNLRVQPEALGTDLVANLSFELSRADIESNGVATRRTKKNVRYLSLAHVLFEKALQSV